MTKQIKVSTQNLVHIIYKLTKAEFENTRTQLKKKKGETEQSNCPILENLNFLCCFNSKVRQKPT